MELLALIFFVTLALSGAAWWGVSQYFSSRDAAQVHDRLVGKATETPSAGPKEARLFAGDEGRRKSLSQHLLAWLNLDAKLQNAIEQAGIDWAPGQVVILSLACALAAFNLAWYGVLPEIRQLAFVIAIPAAFVPLLYLRYRRKKRVRAFEAQFPDALQFIARAMRAGHAFSVSLDMLRKEFDTPLATEFRTVFEEQNLGLPIDVALEKLAKRMPLMDVRFFVAAVVLQKRTGGNLGEILEKLAELIRERFKLRGQIRTISAQGRMSSVVLTLIPVVVAGMLYFVNRPHMLFFAQEEIGRWMAGGAAGLVLVGYFIMSRIVKIEV